MRKQEMGARARKTRFTQVERPAPPGRKKEAPAPPPPDLPSPEPIKLSADITETQKAPPPGNGHAAAPAAPQAIQAPTAELKLDLGCGQSPETGYEGVDLYSKEAKHKVDLFRFPWPWKDSSVDEMRSSHFVEHIPMVYLCKKHGHESYPCEGAQDLFFAFFDECWRILKPGAKFHIIVPTCKSERAFQDPTHRRFIAQATFLYLNVEWRKVNRLDHYNAKCNFAGNVNFSFDASLKDRHQEVQQEAFQRHWNVLHDWITVLQTIK